MFCGRCVLQDWAPECAHSGGGGRGGVSWLTGLCAENRGRSNLGAGSRYTESTGGGLREVVCGRCVLQDARPGAPTAVAAGGVGCRGSQGFAPKTGAAVTSGLAAATRRARGVGCVRWFAGGACCKMGEGGRRGRACGAEARRQRCGGLLHAYLCAPCCIRVYVRPRPLFSR